MPIELKNARATYQRAMKTIFHEKMHTFKDDYVDDLLAKSFTKEGHLEILVKIFNRLEKSNL
jgi:hypothetical protein